MSKTFSSGVLRYLAAALIAVNFSSFIVLASGLPSVPDGNVYEQMRESLAFQKRSDAPLLLLKTEQEWRKAALDSQRWPLVHTQSVYTWSMRLSDGEVVSKSRAGEIECLGLDRNKIAIIPFGQGFKLDEVKDSIKITKEPVPSVNELRLMRDAERKKQELRIKLVYELFREWNNVVVVGDRQVITMAIWSSNFEAAVGLLVRPEGAWVVNLSSESGRRLTQDDILRLLARFVEE